MPALAVYSLGRRRSRSLSGLHRVPKANQEKSHDANFFFAALIGNLALAASLAAAPADACGRKHWKGADGGPVHGYKHWRHARAELK